jgi:cyclopropane fatty-acyl-phospholipid synthase-like methyltransferase
MDDVPSPIDLRDPVTAARWAAEANRTRPYRNEILERMAKELRDAGPASSLLELGSGPGFLAEALLESVPVGSYTLLDFSDAMHDLARGRLEHHASRCVYVTADFSKPAWSAGLGPFDAIVTLQAVHELRHKRHAASLHRAVRALLERGGLYLVCDHFAGAGGMPNHDLYATIEEQAEALTQAGFRDVRQIYCVGSLVLHQGVA